MGGGGQRLHREPSGESHADVPLAYQNEDIWQLCSHGHMQGPVGLRQPPTLTPSMGGQGCTGSHLGGHAHVPPGLPEWRHLTTLLTWPHARPCGLELVLGGGWLTPTWALLERLGLHSRSAAPISTELPCLASCFRPCLSNLQLLHTFAQGCGQTGNLSSFLAIPFLSRKSKKCGISSRNPYHKCPFQLLNSSHWLQT